MRAAALATSRRGLAQLARVPEALPESCIRKVMSAAAQMEAHGHTVVHLEVGQPNFDPPPLAIKAAQAALDAGVTRYVANAGLRGLREAVAESYAARHPHLANHGIDRILCTHGSMFSYATGMMATLEPGDEVLLPDPGYPNYEQTIQMLHAEAVHYPLHLSDGWMPRMADLERLATPRTKMLLLNTPSNPTGAVLPQRLLDEMWRFCQEHDLFCLSDEVYSEIVFDQPAPAPSLLKSPGAADDPRAMVTSGVAKSHAMTGFRVGWLRGHPSLIEVASRLQEPFVSCGVPFSQAAAEAVLRDPELGARAVGLDAYIARRDLAIAILEEYGLKEYSPQGAFYLLVNCSRSGLGSGAFADALLATRGVAVAPGFGFGEKATSHVRVALCSSEADIEVGMRAICEAITRGL